MGTGELGWHSGSDPLRRPTIDIPLSEIQELILKSPGFWDLAAIIVALKSETWDNKGRVTSFRTGDRSKVRGTRCSQPHGLVWEKTCRRCAPLQSRTRTIPHGRLKRIGNPRQILGPEQHEVVIASPQNGPSKPSSRGHFSHSWGADGTVLASLASGPEANRNLTLFDSVGASRLVMSGGGVIMASGARLWRGGVAELCHRPALQPII